MAVALKNKTVAPSAATLTTLYTCPASTTAVVGILTVCNRSATATTYRIATRPLGAAIANEYYHCYDITIDGNSTDTYSGLCFVATDILSVYATLATVSFNVSLQENS
jgi:hypothetical protein